MMEGLVLAIDESGNTGNNITDKNQPYFCLSSVLLSSEEVRFVEDLISSEAKEYHFVNLRRNRSYQDKLIQLFNSGIADRRKVKQSVVDKSYGTTVQLVNLLIEPVLFRRGVDIYKNGMQYGYANTLHAFIESSSFGEDSKLVLHYKFVEMLRKNDGASKSGFYMSFAKLYNANMGQKGVELLEPILGSITIIEEIIREMDKYQLDFTIGSFLYLTAEWTKQLNSELFDIKLDRSKQFDYWDELISIVKSRSLMKPSNFSMHLSSLQFPISANEVKQVDSSEHRDVQIADLFASATTYALKERDKENPSEFAIRILGTNILETVTHPVVFDRNHIDEIKKREGSMDYIVENISTNRIRIEGG